MILRFSASIFAALAIVASCSTPEPVKKAACMNERTRETIIRWGDYNPKTGEMKAYQFTGGAIRSKFLRTTSSSDPVLSLEKPIAPEDFCRYLALTLRTFDTIQTLHAPGAEQARFIEYTNTTTNASARAIWNPAYQTYGSKEFRAVYDSLMTIIPTQERW